MASPFSEIGGGFGGTVGNIVSGASSIVFKIGIAVFALLVVAVLVIWNRNRKKYNIPVTIWIPRSDGKITDEITGKNVMGGYFKSADGSTRFRLKRKGIPVIDLPPPSSRFLVGLSRKLYFVQKGPDDFEPVLPDSFRHVTTPSGKKLAVIDLKAVNQDATAWVEDNREAAKRRFTFHGFWERYKDFIQITIFIFIVMLSMYINWMGLKDVVDALQNVANTYNCVGGPVIN